MAEKTTKRSAESSDKGEADQVSADPRGAADELLGEPAAAGAATIEPVPLEVPLEEQITKLPPLVYPGSNNEEFDQWASDKRRNRVRLEIIGAVILLIAGAVASIVSGRPAFIVVALFGIAALGVYEFLVTSFE